jgi:serine/arginine repetitive matrix protein 1
VFCKDLWKLLLSAQSSPQGVPKELLEAKKLELIQEKVCQPLILYSSIPDGF